MIGSLPGSVLKTVMETIKGQSVTGTVMERVIGSVMVSVMGTRMGTVRYH